MVKIVQLMQIFVVLGIGVVLILVRLLLMLLFKARVRPSVLLPGVWLIVFS